MRRLAFLAAVWAVLAPGTARSQVLRAAAFGDSVTLGVPFDDERATTCSPASPSFEPNFCGYSVRLSEADYYDCTIDTCFFDNLGRGGESTVAGLTRIDGVLGRAWDLVTIMEGTNDVLEISTESIAFNLEAMADKVEARSAAAVLASIIWFNPSTFRADLGQLNAEGDRLRDSLASRASARKRCFVDVRSRLCPSGADQASCFAQNYWTPEPGVVDPLGHVNSKGYDVMAAEFYAALGAVGPPGAAQPTAPLDEEVCGSAVMLEWRKEDIADASCGNWYLLEIEGSKRVVFSGWVSEEVACSGRSCSFLPTTNLGRGEYTFRVTTRNTAGYGPVSEETSFSALRNAPDAVTALSRPRGPVFSAGGFSAPFEWQPVKDARTYRLELVSGKGRVVLDETVAAVDACTESTCSFTPSDPLPTDRYTWRVEALNVCGGAPSALAAFEVFANPPAAAPLTAGPASRLYDPSPSYRWESVAGATQYEVQRASGAISTVDADEVCIGGICRLTAGPLAPGSHTWRVRAVNPLGTGEWSSTVSFQIVDCACERASTAGGATVLIAVPEPWNGDLVIWAPESNAFGVRELTELGPLADLQFDAGYALASTSYSVAGWPLFKSKRDLEKLVAQFTQRHGTPTRVFLVGRSVGALVAAAGLEKARLGNAVGALALCAPVDVQRTWEAALDLRLAYDAICSAVPGTDLPGGATGLPADHGLEPRDVEEAFELCTGFSRPAGRRSKSQTARLAALSSVGGVPEAGLPEALELATFGLADLVADKKKLRGGVPVGNVGVVYPGLELYQAIERVAPEGRAARKLERFSRLSGNVGAARMLALHTSDDPRFFVENLGDLATLMPPESLVTAVAVESDPSHCGFSTPELLTAWLELVDWVEGGEQPEVPAMERRCDRAAETVPGECRFDAGFEPGTMAGRVPARP